MADTNKKLSFVEKAGYSLGDGAANFVFQTMIMFQLTFYTDTLGISAAAAGSLLLVARLWDAFFDPMMGAMADRTQTRWGKFRPWVLWTAVPWGVVMVLAYTAPSLDFTGKLIYATVTNILLMTLYSANNTPYSALTGVMTADINERTTLSSYRFVAVMIAQIVVAGFTLPLVAKFGQGDNARGWRMTMSVWAVICVACFLITFATTRERIRPNPEQKSSLRADFSGLLKNSPWICMFTVTLFHFGMLAMRGGSMYYYFQYYVDQTKLLGLLQSLGLDNATGTGVGQFLLNTFGLVVNSTRTNVAGVGYSLFSMSSQIVTLLGVLTSTWLTIRYGKKVVAIWGFVLTTTVTVLFIFLPANAIGATILLEWLRVLTYGPTIPLLWSMFADVADYAEWQTGRRATGIVYATIIFGLKAGLSLGGAVAGWLLSGFGYQANAAQTTTSLLGIRLVISVFPAIFLGVVIVCLILYKIDKTLNLRIASELAERRARFAPSEGSAS